MLVNLQVVESPKMSLMAFALAEYLGFMKEIITIKTNTPHFSRYVLSCFKCSGLRMCTKQPERQFKINGKVLLCGYA